MKLLRLLLLAGFAGLLGDSSARAVVVNWLGGTNNNVQLPANWVGGVAPTSADEARFQGVGSNTLDVPAAWNVRYIGFDSTPNYSFNGVGTITIGTTGSNGNIDTFLGTGTVTFNNAGILMQRASPLYAASSATGSGDLIINTTTFKMGGGGSSGTPAMYAVNGNITVNPAVDFSASTINRNLSLQPYAGRTITLTNGVAATTRLAGVYVEGQAGGKVVLGNSTTWAGMILIYNSDLEINHNDSLGAPGQIAGSYGGQTEFLGGATATGALVLTNNITTGEAMFLSTRSTNAAEIKNKSGHNTLSGVLGVEVSGSVSAPQGNLITLQSDGTAGGDLFEIYGSIQPTTYATGANTVVLQGAGNGLVSGVISSTVIVSGSGSGSGGTLGVTKDGGGTWTLSGSNTYTDATNIVAGTLSLGATGSIFDSSSINIKSGANFVVSGLAGGTYILGASQNLKGAGTVTGGITASYGNTITPGDSAGTLNITGGLSLTGGTLAYELTNNPGGVNDKIVLGGALTVLGNPNFALTALNGSLGSGNYRLIDYVGPAISNPNSTFSYSGVTPSGRQSFAFASAANQLELVVTGSSANLVWVGGTNANAWDVGSTVNWTGAPGPAFDNRFYDTDNVTFNDSGTTFTPNVVGTVSPGNATFANTTGNNYTVSGGNIAVINDLAVSGSGNVIFTNGDLSAAGSFILNGTGKTTLSNTGLITLPTVALNSGTLAVNRLDDVALSGALSGGGTLRKEGTNTVTVNGNNATFAGAMVVAGGTLRTVGNNALGTAAGGVTVENGATLDIWDNGANNADPGTETVSIIGSGVGEIGALISTQSSDSTSAHVNKLILTGNAKIAAIGDTARSIIWIGGPGAALQGNGFNIDVAVNIGTNKTGTEIDWINVGDANLNNITISGGGVLYIGGNTTLGPTSGTLTLQNKGRLGIYGSLAGAASTGTIDKPINVESTFSGGGIELYLGNKTVDSPITLNGNLDVNTYSSSGTSVLTLAGKITGVGGMTLHQESNSGTTSRRGMVQLTSNDNDFTGPITVGGGGGFGGISAARDRIQLSVGNGGTTGSLGTGDVTLYGISSYVFLDLNRGGAYTVTNNIINNDARIYSSHASGDVTLTGVISGTGRIYADAGIMTLAGSGVNTFTGTVVINNDSRLVIAKNSALGDFGNSVDGYTEPLGGTVTSALVLKNNLTGVGEFIWLGPRDSFANPQIISQSGDNTLSGTIEADLLAGYHSYALQSDGTDVGDIFRISGTIQTAPASDIPGGLGGDSNLSLQGAGKGSITGTIIENNAQVWNLAKNGTGTWTLAGNNTYTGTTTISAGTLELAATGQIAGSSSITNDATFRVNGGTHALKAVLGTGAMDVTNNASVTLPSIVQNSLSIGGSVNAASVPEPGTFLLLALAALAGLAVWRRK
jgi:fibronectin-binding autotransporter adhesin